MIAANSGTQFDPDLVNEFLNIGNVIKECLNEKEQMVEKREFFSVRDIIG